MNAFSHDYSTILPNTRMNLLRISHCSSKACWLLQWLHLRLSLCTLHLLMFDTGLGAHLDSLVQHTSLQIWSGWKSKSGIRYEICDIIAFFFNEIN